MIHLALFEPEIPPNTGNIIRLCANTGVQLHLIEPLGFDLSDKRLRRAGLDYAEFASIKLYPNWQHFCECQQTKRIIGLTTKGEKCFFDIKFNKATDSKETDGKEADGKETVILLGPETRGLPDTILNELGKRNCYRIPMAENSRSLNLSNTAAICVYEAWRQYAFSDML